MIKVSDSVPVFSLPDSEGVMRSPGDYIGKWVLLYFYPKDDTPGCTAEACSLRDNLPQFDNLEAVVLGVSVDSVKSHKKFAEKYGLPFTLLADENKEVVQAYGVWQKKKMIGREYMGTVRTSFLINPEGKVAKIYEKVKPAEHTKEVLADLDLLTGRK